MDNTNANVYARRAQRDQGTRDLCSPSYVRLVVTLVKDNQHDQTSTSEGKKSSQTGGDGPGK